MSVAILAQGHPREQPSDARGALRAEAVGPRRDSAGPGLPHAVARPRALVAGELEARRVLLRGGQAHLG